MMNRRIISCFLLSLFLFLFSSLTLNAVSASYSLGGNSSVEVNQNITITVNVNNISGGEVGGVAGKIEWDSTALQLISSSGVTSPFAISGLNSANKFTGFTSNQSGFSGNKQIVTITFKALKVGSATISLTSPDISDISGVKGSASGASKTITITAPLSSNTNLSSLSASGTNISTGNLTANVGKDVTSTTISATAEDSGATVSGTGTKTLNYGANKFTITVKAPSGATRDYTITINREDPRSTNANLSSLKVSGQDLTPGFNKNTTTYSMTVPFSVSSLDIKAVAEDSNAKVAISGNTNLPAEATTAVTIKVTAENGSVKTYTINVTREKDPNKPKSNNNYLTSITTNIGILSPVFDKEKTNYVIYLPFEIDRVELTVDVEDKEYGVLETSGPETLNVGTNRYEFKVTAEDGTTRSYIVNVIRGANVDGSSSNVLLKDIEITNGSLDKKFSSEVNVYRYEKKKDFKLTPIPEDENTKVTVLENDDVYTIILETSNGEMNVYTLIPEDENSSSSSNNLGIIIASIIISIPLIGGGGYIGYKYGMKKMLNKVKSTMPSYSSLENDNVVYEENPKSKKPKKEKKKKNKKQPESETQDENEIKDEIDVQDEI